MQAQVVGTVQAVQRATIAAKLTGTIEQMPVVLGSQVTKGDLLVKISAGEIEARLAQARAQLAQADRNLERERKLLAKKATTAETVKSLEDTKRIAQATFREAQTMYGYVNITAPFAGLVTNKPANVGDLAVPGQALIQIENLEQLQVVTAVPEARILQTRVGDILPVHIPAATLELEGRVVEIAPAADPMSRTAPIKLDLPPDPNLRPGQFARVMLPGRAATTLTVPRAAVQAFGQMEKVYVVKDDQAVLRLVRTGTTVDDRVEILSGLRAGEKVIVQAQAPLTDNQPIRAE